MNLVYIVGRGHTGSTVLDLILSNHPDIFSVGEISMGLRRMDKELGEGSSDAKKVFWGQMLTNFKKRFTGTTIEHYVKMLSYMDNWYRIPQIVLSWKLPGWVENNYVPMTRYLFEELSDISNTKIICDSSKEFGRCFFLLSKFPEETKAIYIVRHGEDIMDSYLKRWSKFHTFHFRGKYFKMKNPFFMMFVLPIAFSVSEVFAQCLKIIYGKRILRVRYEDLCKNPKLQLKRIGSFLRVDLSAVAEKIDKSKPLHIGPILGGNNMKNDESGQFVFKWNNIRKNISPLYKVLYRVNGFVHWFANKY